MVVDERVTNALDLKGIILPESVPIVRLWAEDYSDWEGNDALMVHAILPEDLEVERVKGRDFSLAKAAIRDSLRAQGVSVFPYITMYKASEADENSENGRE
jgi:hypothetical protein